MSAVEIQSRVGGQLGHADLTIPGLDRALDSRRMQPILAALLQTQPVAHESVRLMSTRMVRHKPGRRCVVRYELDTHDGDAIQRQSLLGKIRARGFDRRTYELMQQLWAGRFGPKSGDAIRVPEPVGAVPELNMWLQRRIEAHTLAEQLDLSNAEDLCFIAAVALYKLHTSGPRAGRRHTANDEIHILNKGLDKVKEQLVCFAQRIEQVQQACQSVAQHIDDYVPASIHRDFYPDQLLMDGDSVWLLDLDLYAEGDPAIDTGNFVAHLQEMSLRRFGHCHAYTNLERAFLEGYRVASGRPLSFSVQNYVTLTLARHIAISRRFSSRHHTTEALIGICEQRLGIRSSSSFS